LRVRTLGTATLAVLFVACTEASGKQPTEKWEPLPSVTFTQINRTTEDTEPYITVVETPEPTRPKIRVKQPKPQPSVTPQEPRRAPVTIKGGGSKALAKRYALDRLGASQFSCIEALWERESSWRYWAHNKSSGAYGIPQALPGSKMKSAGSDWRTNPVTQVRWGIRYVNSRYGSACRALTFHNRVGWY